MSKRMPPLVDLAAAADTPHTGPGVEVPAPAPALDAAPRDHGGIPISAAGAVDDAVQAALAARLGALTDDAVLLRPSLVATPQASATAGPPPTISVADLVVGEGDGFAYVTVTLSAPSASAVSVAYTTANATAAAGYDYTAVSGTLNFAAGETTKTVAVELLQSASYDSGALEHFRFNLSSPTNATLAKASAMVSIVDNDTALAVGAQPTLFVRDVVVDEKAGTASFVVLLGGVDGVASTNTVKVDYAVAGGNATSGSDYDGSADALSGTLTFAAGEVVKTVTVAIKDDGAAEDIERINLTLDNAVNATIVDANGVAVVGASDAATAAVPTLSVAGKVVSEGDGYIDMVVALSAPSASNVSVNYATANGTAAAGYDYTAASGTLNFAAGETTKTVRIELEQSSSYDTPGVQEAFTLNLSAAVNATIATPSATITIVDDDLAGQKVFSYGISDDVYTITSATDVIVENVDGGTDLVNSSIDYTLGPTLENLTLVGTAINGTGNDLDNVLTGNSKANTLTGLGGNDWLDGASGADAMLGGTGNDTYVVDNAGDTVTENAGEGTDLVRSSISYTLTPYVENLTLTGSANINGTGNDLANVLTGNDGNNALDGKAGADTMIGMAGNDTYTVDDAGDTVPLAPRSPRGAPRRARSGHRRPRLTHMPPHPAPGSDSWRPWRDAGHGRGGWPEYTPLEADAGPAPGP